MSFNVNKFRSAFSGAKQDYVIAPSNYFEVQFMDLPRVFDEAFKRPNKGIQKTLAHDAFRNMRFRCQHADIPSKMLTPQVRTGYMGPNRTMPTGATFQPLQLDFLETPRFNIRAFFDAWTEVCEGFHNGYINEYYDDIIMPEINIMLYTRDGKKVARWTLYDCYPSSTNHSSVSWESNDSAIVTGVEISYHRWESTWYDIAKSDCSIDTDTIPEPKRTPSPPRLPTPRQEPIPEQPKQQILRNEWGEPYITSSEQQGKQLAGIDTTKYENRVIDTSTWNKTGVKAPTNKI